MSKWEFRKSLAANDAEGIVPPGLMERRSRIRFPLRLPVSYATLKTQTRVGVGWLANLSSHGLLVEKASSHRLKPGIGIRVIIDWPVLLDGRVTLKLVIVGTVVRCEESKFAVVKIHSHFRTKKAVQKANLPTWRSGRGRLLSDA